MNGICSAKLNESNLTSLGCLIGRKSHIQSHSGVTCERHQYPRVRMSRVSREEGPGEEGGGEGRDGGRRREGDDIKM